MRNLFAKDHNTIRMAKWPLMRIYTEILGMLPHDLDTFYKSLGSEL